MIIFIIRYVGRRWSRDIVWRVEWVNESDGQEGNFVGSGRAQFRLIMYHLAGIRRPTVTKEIENIHFAHLTSLDCSGNQIYSIEGLPCVRAPYIQHLWLNTYSLNQAITTLFLWPSWERQPGLPSELSASVGNQWCRQELFLGCLLPRRSRLPWAPNTHYVLDFPELQILIMYFDWKNGEELNQFTDASFSKIQSSSLKWLCTVPLM